MIADGDVNVVENIVRVGLVIVLRDDARVLRVSALVDVAAHREACGAVLLVAFDGVAPSHLQKQHQWDCC